MQEELSRQLPIAQKFATSVPVSSITPHTTVTPQKQEDPPVGPQPVFGKSDAYSEEELKEIKDFIATGEEWDNQHFKLLDTDMLVKMLSIVVGMNKALTAYATFPDIFRKIAPNLNITVEEFVSSVADGLTLDANLLTAMKEKPAIVPSSLSMGYYFYRYPSIEEPASGKSENWCLCHHKHHEPHYRYRSDCCNSGGVNQCFCENTCPNEHCGIFGSCKQSSENRSQSAFACQRWQPDQDFEQPI